MTVVESLHELTAEDGHRWQLIGRLAPRPRAALLWLPALGVAARHYLPLADTLAAHGVSVLLHEWRGNGSSSLRPSRQCDWGYRELLQHDLPLSFAQLRQHAGDARVIIGGHSLGGQLACCLAALASAQPDALWLVASGTPYWRSFPAPLRHALPLVYRFLPWLAQRQGVLHGRRLRFAGTEARGLIADWARVGISNRYRGRGIDVDLEQAMHTLRADVAALVFARDAFAPASSMQALLDKLPSATTTLECLDADALGTRADHFAWMKQPHAVAAHLLRTLR